MKSQHEPRMATLDGEKYPIMLTMNALAEIEEEANMPFAAFFDKIATGQGTLKDQVILLLACLHGGGTDISEEELMALDFTADIMPLWALVTDMVAEQAPFDEGDDPGKKPKA